MIYMCMYVFTCIPIYISISISIDAYKFSYLYLDIYIYISISIYMRMGAHRSDAAEPRRATQWFHGDIGGVQGAVGA